VRGQDDERRARSGQLGAGREEVREPVRQPPRPTAGTVPIARWVEDDAVVAPAPPRLACDLPVRFKKVRVCRAQGFREWIGLCAVWLGSRRLPLGASGDPERIDHACTWRKPGARGGVPDQNVGNRAPCPPATKASVRRSPPQPCSCFFKNSVVRDHDSSAAALS
jgi:hypothetical protein